jgi:hypothetical protein
MADHALTLTLCVLQGPDFAELFGSEAYSDVDVLLYEEPGGYSSTSTKLNKRPRSAEEVLPCHNFVLRALSQYFKTQVGADTVHMAEMWAGWWAGHVLHLNLRGFLSSLAYSVCLLLYQHSQEWLLHAFFCPCTLVSNANLVVQLLTQRIG